MFEVGVAEHYLGDAGERYYAWQSRTGQVGARLNARKFAPYVQRSDVVVDFGSGGGFLLRQLPCADGIGIEPNPAARAEAIAAGTTTVARPEELGDEVADVVISNHALEHTVEPLAELRQLLRILKQGKHLVLWLPLDDWRTQRTVDADDVNRHLYAWTPQLLHNLLTEAGFVVDGIHVVTHAWPPRVEVVSRLPRELFDRLAWLASVIYRRRQLRAVAHRP